MLVCSTMVPACCSCFTRLKKMSKGMAMCHPTV
ncbi:hypothetical protein A2U01_0084217, partial [Trifolium medium]|nr:hypothetical protein [Trifolium medium]